MDIYVIGVDPGPCVGIVVLRLEPPQKRWLQAEEDGPRSIAEVTACQVTPGALEKVLEALCSPADQFTAVAAERFVVGSRSARCATPGGGKAAREVLADVEAWARRRTWGFHAASAADVKPWATDKRLEAAGLLGPTTGMRHARDAGRHALFRACKSWGLPDPLSRKAVKA